MDDCCAVPITSKEDALLCPECKEKGRSIEIITLRALLIPTALETIDPQSAYGFCPNHSCNVVYFSDHQKFQKEDVKVPVFQKDDGIDVPVCYCFGWTRQQIKHAVQQKIQPSKHISEQVQANHCGCEVNNPQGSCCLGNVTSYVHSLGESIQ
jgi:bacterioferritin-associated ferredoxin